MKKNTKKGLMVLTLASLSLAACSKPIVVPETQASTTIESTSISTTESNVIDDHDAAKSSGNVDFSQLAQEIKDNMDADTLEILYSSPNTETIDQDGLEITLDGYELVEVKDFHQDFSSTFGNQTKRGGIMLSQYTIKNTCDKSVYFGPSLDLDFTGSTHAYSNTRHLYPDDAPNLPSIITKQKFEIKAGESITGTTAIPFEDEMLDTILDLGMVTLVVPPAYSEPDKYSKDVQIGQDERVNLSLSAKGDDKLASDSSFYQDKITLENMGEKTLIIEKKDIKQKETLGDLDVTLEGYQFADFEPNADTAARFTNFKNGLVTLTIRYSVKNNSTENIGISSSSSTLLVNNGDQRLLHEGMLLPYRSETIDSGTEGEFLQIFVLDKEQYDKIWKEKDFATELTFRNSDAKDMAKGQKLLFDLPK